MITSSGCNIGFGLPVQMPRQEEMLRHDLMSESDKMADRVSRQMEKAWIDPRLDHRDDYKHTFVPPPKTLEFDSRAFNSPLFPSKSDEEYHFNIQSRRRGLTEPELPPIEDDRWWRRR